MTRFHSLIPELPVTDWVFVDEVDALCAAFSSCGARITAGVEGKPWGYRQFTMEDLNGHLLTFFRFSDGVE